MTHSDDYLLAAPAALDAGDSRKALPSLGLLALALAADFQSEEGRNLLLDHRRLDFDHGFAKDGAAIMTASPDIETAGGRFTATWKSYRGSDASDLAWIRVTESRSSVCGGRRGCSSRTGPPTLLRQFGVQPSASHRPFSLDRGWR